MGRSTVRRMVSAMVVLFALAAPVQAAQAAVTTTFTGGTESGPVKAGAAVVDATYKVGASAGQYASTKQDFDPNGEIDPSLLETKNNPSYGVQARLQARALVIEGADGSRSAMVKNDLYIPQDLVWRRTAQILESKPGLRIGRANLSVMVTHDHSSPYYSSTAPGAWTFQDVFDLRFFEYYAQQMAKAVERAATTMKPVRVGAAVGSLDGPHRHSFGPALADDQTPAGYPNADADHDLSVVRLDDISDPAHPKPLGLVLNWSLHGEMLNGNDLISPDWIGAMERMLDRETGAVTVFQQGSVGTAEPERSAYHSVHERLEFTHREYAQSEFAARLITDEAKRVYRSVDGPASASEFPDRFVPFRSELPVTMADRWYPGPLSHPAPTVGNCRTDQAPSNDPRFPGIPTCETLQSGAGEFGVPVPFGAQDNPFDPGVSAQSAKALGIPVPDNLGTPSYGALEESYDIHLQALRIGDIVLTFCSCEQWADQARNIKSRTNSAQGDQYLGYDWAARCTPVGSQWTCPDPRDERVLLPPISDAQYQRFKAQVRNDAVGWDSIENAPTAESEPTDPARIKGNYTHEELSAANGYTLTIPVAMANDYNGYIATYREYQRGDHYRKALTAWGPHASDYLATRLVELAGHLKQRDGTVLATESRRAAADDLGSAKTPGDLENNDRRAKALGEAGEVLTQATLAKTPSDAGAAGVLEQPAPAVERFGSAFVKWNGGSNFVDNPAVRVERRAQDGWEDFAGQQGEVPVTIRFPRGPDEAAAAAAGQFEWQWTASFEAFVSRFDTGDRPLATPAGEYRFVMDGERRESGATKAYHLVSRPFEVRPWSGITAEGLRREGDGTLSLSVGPRHRFDVPAAGKAPALPGVEIGPIDYPDSYKSPVRFVKDARTALRDPDAPADPAKLEWYCFACTFRPWIDAGDADSVAVRITHADGTTETVPATRRGDRWHTQATLSAGESAVVAAGGVRDAWGNRNGAASNVVSLAGAGAGAGTTPGSGSGGKAGGTGASGGSGGGLPAGCTDRLAPRSRPVRRGSRIRAKRITVVGRSGDQGCAGLAGVLVSVARDVPGRNANCRFLRPSRTFSRTRSCLRTTYLPAKGTTRWRFEMRAKLPRGRYRIWVRGVDRAGNVERKARRRNLIHLTRR